MTKNFLYALTTLSGTIIGVGLFSLPYIASKTGLGVMLFYFIILGAVIILVHLFYGEIALRTKELHRLPGYAEKYLGSWGKIAAFFTTGIGLCGALLAYLIIGGQFLFSFLGLTFGGSDSVYTLIFFFLGAGLIYFGIKSIAKAEFFSLILFFAILLFIFVRGFSLIDLDNLFAFETGHLFLPYGAILFSLAGVALVPEVKEMLKDNPQKLKKLIPLAVFIPIITYLFFIFFVLGVSGSNVSEEAIAGLGGFLDNKVISLALLFGVLTTFTSFIAIGLTLKKVLWYDLGLNKNLAWAITCFVPLSLFFMGFKNFITVISLTGGIMLGLDAIIIILVYLSAKTKGDIAPSYTVSLPRFMAYFLILFFILGIIYEVVYFVG